MRFIIRLSPSLRLTLTTMLMTATMIAKAQPDLPFTLSYIPPSPNVAALGKFGEVPVNLSTGIPSISVPIFQYSSNDKNMSLSVSLDYHAGGIRVEEIASNVGLGWALNAGGNVSRTVRGLPDDLDNYGYLALGTNQTGVIPGNRNDASLMIDYTKNGLDGEQDLFNFSFPGGSGKFVLNGQGNAVQITDSQLIIQTLRSSTTSTYPITGFIITDEKGVKYYFKDQETITTVLSSQLATLPYTSTWHLTKIVNPFTLDSINFTYQNYGATYYNTNYQSYYNHLPGNLSAVVSTLASQSGSGNSYSTSAKRVQKISLPNYSEVNFYYNALSRCDLYGDNGLQSIEVNNLLTSNKKTFTLYQTYLGPSGVIPYSSSACTTGATVTNLRLRLDSVAESAQSITFPAYVFTYNDANGLLPDRTSMMQDWWGYYNSNSSATLVPDLSTFNDTGGITYLPGANRTPDTTRSSSSSLISIRYPTGGTTTLQYEANRAGDGKLVTTKLSVPKAPVNGSLSTSTYSFSVNRDLNLSVQLNFTLGSWCSSVGNTCIFTFTVKDASGTTYSTVSFANSDVGTTKLSNLSSFPNGIYTLNYTLSSGCTCTDPFSFALTWQQINYDSTQISAGIRVKTVTDYDGISHSNDIVKNYRYKLKNGKSSGTVGTVPHLTYQWKGTLEECNQCLYLVRTATTNSPLTYYTGALTSYSYVEVTTTGQNGVANGREASYFSSFREWIDQYKLSTLSAPPFNPPQAIEWAMGKMTQRDVFDATGNKLTSETNQYSVTEVTRTSLNNLRVYCYESDMPEEPSSYEFATYNWTTGHCWNTLSTKTTYSSPTDSMVEVSMHDYDSTHFALKKTRTVRSFGDTIETRLYYPYDYVSVSVFPSMKTANMINKPVSSETWLMNGSSKKMIGGYVLDYLQQTPLIAPSKYYTLSTSAPIDYSVAGNFSSGVLLRSGLNYRQEVTFENYDANGNPLQLLNKHVRKSYIWDYKKRSVIAEATNASVSDIAYTSFEADGSGNWTIPSSSRVTTNPFTGFQSYNLTNGNNITKTGLSSAQTYLVSFWATSTSVTVNSSAPTAGLTNNNGWTYYQIYVTGATTVTISSGGASVNIDELRLHPKGAIMTTYSYDPAKGVKSISDPNGQPGLFEYDDIGRLITIRDPLNKVMKTAKYHYKNQTGTN